MLEQKEIEVLLTYKLSQDHVELLFSLLRSMNSFNNNPRYGDTIASYSQLYSAG